MATSTCLILGFLSSILTLTIIGVSIASSQWLKIRAPFFKNDVGLMRHCDVLSSDYCGDMEQLHDLVNSHYIAWFKSVQALYLLHCIGALISTSLYILYTFKFFESKDSFKIVTGFNFVTLACGIYSVSVFGTSYHKFFHLEGVTDEVAWFGCGFYTAVTGCCLTFIVMLLSAMEASHAAAVIQNMRSRITVWTSPYTLFVEQETA